MENFIRRYCSASLLFAALALSFAQSAYAVETPLVYARSSLKILPLAPEVKEGETPPPAPEPIIIDVEIRPNGVFEQPGMYFTRTLREDEVYLQPFAPGAYPSIAAANVYTPLDVVVINNEGKVVKLFPSLVLHDLAQPIMLQQDHRAILFMAEGNAKNLALQPGAQVSHPLFAPQPKPLEEAPKAEPQVEDSDAAIAVPAQPGSLEETLYPTPAQ